MRAATAASPTEPDVPVTETDITEADIAHLVHTFYAKARRDPLLGPVFEAKIGRTDAEWDAHFARLRDFWSSLMLRSGRYRGDPFSVHLAIPDIAPPMFERWLLLFGETADALFTSDLSEAFKTRAARIARSLRMGLFERELRR